MTALLFSEEEARQAYEWLKNTQKSKVIFHRVNDEIRAKTIQALVAWHMIMLWPTEPDGRFVYRPEGADGQFEVELYIFGWTAVAWWEWKPDAGAPPREEEIVELFFLRPAGWEGDEDE